MPGGEVAHQRYFPIPEGVALGVVGCLTIPEPDEQLGDAVLVHIVEGVQIAAVRNGVQKRRSLISLPLRLVQGRVSRGVGPLLCPQFGKKDHVFLLPGLVVPDGHIVMQSGQDCKTPTGKKPLYPPHEGYRGFLHSLVQLSDHPEVPKRRDDQGLPVGTFPVRLVPG